MANVYANLGLVYEDTEQLDRAITQYQKALELLPLEPSLHRDLAGVYWKQRRYAEAEPHYEAVVADDATDVQVLYRLGLIFLTKGDCEDAIVRFEKVIEFDAAHVHAYEAAGIAYQELGDNPKAIEAFEKVLRLEPNNKNALERLKELHESK